MITCTTDISLISNKKIRIIAQTACIVLFCLFFTTSCGSTNSPHLADPLQESLTLQDLLDTAHERRQGIYPPNIERLEELTYGRTPRTIDIREDERFFNYHPFGTILSIPSEEAIYDVQLFFDVLRQIYGGYIYFGGDEVFVPLFDEIIEEIASQERWGIDNLARLLYLRLNPYIHDNHLSIGGGVEFFSNRFESNYCVFTNDTIFDRTENGFRNRDNGLYVQEVVGYDKDDVFRLTVNEYGEFYYTLVIEGPYYRGAELIIVYENGKETITQFDVTREGTAWPEYHEPSLEFIDGFPVITINAMYMEQAFFYEDVIKANTFLSFVDELRHESAIIIDLRENGGGNMMLAARWLYNLIGEFVPNNHVWLTVEDYDTFMATRVGGIGDPDDPFYLPFCIVMEQRIHTPFDENHVITYPSGINRSDSLISNGQIIIFLTSRFTASAAEDFVDMAFSMENTLIIGHNTAGGLFADLTHTRLLPYSGIHFGLGTMLFLHAEAHNFREGVGLVPDLWVPHQDDALPAALALLRNHFAESE